MKKKSRLFWATVMVALCTSGLSCYSGEVFAEEYTKGLVGDYDKDQKTVGDHVVKNGEDNLTYDFSI